MVTLPDGIDTCDIGTIAIRCEAFFAIFTQLEVPRDIFVSMYYGTNYIYHILS